MIKNISTIINMNNPGHYYHWSILTISAANLILIFLMVLIFFLALVLPFPGNKEKFIESSDSENDESSSFNTIDKKMWTSRFRLLWMKHLPPNKLIPDTQPAYVSSWIYVFGVATLAALFMVIVSGFALAIGGVDWWHTTAVGHFFNSLHLWSVELFMAFMVIHLWGKFWMAAWRGKRALTWMTGVVSFVVSVLAAFTGYLSQQNFDSQWIATNGKDAINATGVGGFFNLMNFGQMITWHIVLIPLALVAIIGGHILLVRIRGVSHPLPKKVILSKVQKKQLKISDTKEWHGPKRKYDILKEGTIATIIVLILVFGLASLLSSPDEPPVTVQSWANIAPADFMGTVVSELNGTSETANYGPPYNNGNHNVQTIIVSPQLFVGIRQPINSPDTFVINPLDKLSVNNPGLKSALNEYTSATSQQQIIWLNNFINGLSNLTFSSSNIIIPRGNYGPVETIVINELSYARSGAIDSALLTQQPFYGSNYTKPLLFLEDGSYFSSLAQKDHLVGTQWGVMNETGSYPGQPWLWLYTLWYQIPSFSSSANVDLIAILMTLVSTILLMLVPFIPILRDIPRYIPIHRLIYRNWHKTQK